jgi:hypothetical protein
MIPNLVNGTYLPSLPLSWTNIPSWHLDVKPSNILVASDSALTPYEWKFQLADFNLTQFKTAKFSNESDTPGTSSYGTHLPFHYSQPSNLL